MSSMLSTWPVLLLLPVAQDDLDESGRLGQEAGERLFTSARDVYLRDCRTLEAGGVQVVDVVVAAGSARLAPGEVAVSVSAVELFPDRFTMHLRIRPGEGEGIAAEGRCSVLVDGGVTADVRDELIARAHAARHYN